MFHRCPFMLTFVYEPVLDPPQPLGGWRWLEQVSNVNRTRIPGPERGPGGEQHLARDEQERRELVGLPLDRLHPMLGATDDVGADQAAFPQSLFGLVLDVMPAMELPVAELVGQGETVAEPVRRGAAGIDGVNPASSFA